MLSLHSVRLQTDGVKVKKPEPLSTKSADRLTVPRQNFSQVVSKHYSMLFFMDGNDIGEMKTASGQDR